VLALAVGVIQRGGYNSTTRVAVVLISLGALVAALLGRSRPAGTVLVALVVGWASLAGSALLSAAVAGDPGGALEIVGLLTVFAAGVAAASATPVPSRPLLADALLLVAVVVAATAWVGVVWRINPLAYPVGGLWRGASTLTYANAAAALLGMVFVLTVVRLAADPRVGRLAALGTYLAGVGIVTTLNRAGVIAVAAGLVVAVLATRPARVWPIVLRQGVAVGIASVGVLPILVDERPTRPVLSVLALLAGAAVAAGIDREWSRRTTAMVLALGGVLLVAGVVVVAPSLGDGADRLADARLSIGGDDRTGAWSAAVEEFEASPLVGQGPSTANFVWTDGGEAWRIKYVHNEYLELLATQGLLSALAGLVAAALLIRTSRGVDLGEGAWLRAAVLGALVTFFVHAGFDFLLHVPALALAAGLISGLALPDSATVSDVGAGRTSVTHEGAS